MRTSSSAPNISSRKLKTYLGRVIRDIGRRIADDQALQEIFARELSLARHVLAQDRHQRGRKVYSLHAPEVECIGKGKAHKPYEFGIKMSVATPAKRCADGQFVARIAALPGNPYDGHTLANVVPAMQALLGNVLDHIIADAGYRGHNAPAEHKFRVYTAGQKRRVNQQIKCEFKRRAAIEPVIGHLKDDHRMGRNYLAHSSGDELASSRATDSSAPAPRPGSASRCICTCCAMPPARPCPHVEQAGG
jgi:transposase, IS5 family